MSAGRGCKNPGHRRRERERSRRPDGAGGRAREQYSHSYALPSRRTLRSRRMSNVPCRGEKFSQAFTFLRAQSGRRYGGDHQLATGCIITGRRFWSCSLRSATISARCASRTGTANCNRLPSRKGLPMFACPTVTRSSMSMPRTSALSRTITAASSALAAYASARRLKARMCGTSWAAASIRCLSPTCISPGASPAAPAAASASRSARPARSPTRANWASDHPKYPEFVPYLNMMREGQ